ncbi:MAG: N-6 DNA methylase [Chloroflexi bacterium]|nr:N-6 DNA methylase [Chloroflexota bacterium]
MKITELTLEKEIVRLLEKWLNCTSVTQASVGGKRPDVLLDIAERRFVIELEVGGSRKMLEAVTQAFGYAQQIQVEGMIGLVYPESARRTIDDQKDILDVVQNTPIDILVIAKTFSQHFTNITLKEFARKFSELLKTKQPKADARLVTRVLREAVETLSLKLRRRQGVPQPALDVVISHFELFEALSVETKSQKGKMKRDLSVVACDLAAYVLVNQLLLYHLLSRTLNLPPLIQASDFGQLKSYFGRVTDIDYRAVYNVDILPNLPVTAFSQVQQIALAFRAIGSEYVPHDLLGRIFHELLPFETRKLLATFYTRPVAAELLAALSFETGKEVALDPACGSGTLLVSAYRQKRNLDPKFQHRRALQKEIYGSDIMPFAAHLAALNLTLQNLDEVTDRVNVGLGNSLELGPESDIRTQLSLFETQRKRVTADSVKLPGHFELPKTVDVVIMNPPYTDRKRLEEGMFGGQANAFKTPQNYWAYFLKLSHGLLKEGGRISAVLPRLFLAGSYSREVREWLFKNGDYTLRYIVRTCREIAFSEAAAFRDFLIVMDKGKSQHQCGIVYLKASLRELTLEEAREIGERVKKIKEGRAYSDAEVEVSWVTQKVVQENWANLGFLVGYENAEDARVLSKFYEKILVQAEKSKALIKLADVSHLTVKRGLEPRPPGMYDATFIVRPLDERRLRHSLLILEKEGPEGRVVSMKGTKRKIKVPPDVVLRAIKTASYISSWKIDKVADRLITRRFDGYKSNIETILGIRVDFSYVDAFSRDRLTHLLVTKRVDLGASGTSALAFFSSEQIVSANVLYSVITSPEYSKALCLWFNSAYGILQYFISRMETHGAFCDLLQETLIDLWVPTPEFVKQNQKTFNSLMTKYGETPLPSLLAQFSKPPKARKELDIAILKMLGWKDSEIKATLPKIYKALASELQLAVAAMSEKSVVRVDDDEE